MPQSEPDPLARAVEQLTEMLGEMEIEPLALEGGITNRNFRARFGGAEIVIRLPGKDTGQLGIDRRAECEATATMGRAGVGPEVVALLDDPPCLVTRFLEGEKAEAEDLRGALAPVAAILRRVHAAGPVSASFSPFRIVGDYAERAGGRGARLPPDQAWGREIATKIETALTGAEHLPVACHNDLLAANFIRSRDGYRIVDWEYAGMGDRFFDLGNFAVNNGLDAGLEEAFLGSYFEAEATPAQLASLRLMRVMSDFREAMWGVLQGTLSDLEFDFGDYASRHFARMRETAADPAFDSWLEDVRVAAG